MKRTGRLLPALFLCCAGTAMALDFGLLVTQNGEFAASGGSDPGFSYTSGYSPWISAELSRTARLYVSAKVSQGYEGDEWNYQPAFFLPELSRTVLSWRPASAVYVEMGRLWFQDAQGLIAAGLFDGLNGSLVWGKARISGGILYSGLLYKESARIIMSAKDVENYGRPLDYEDFAGTYFGSRRMLVQTGLELGDLGPRSSLTLNGLAQFDLNDDSDLHSQYLEAHYAFSPLDSLTLLGTAVLGLREGPMVETPADENSTDENSPLPHFAALLGFDWEVPGALQDMIQAEARWSSGAAEKIAAFTPITALPQGQVFTPTLSGLASFRGKYTARLHRTFTASVEGTYFVRTDEGSVSGQDFSVSDARLLGGELFGSLLWAPKSDIALTLQGGAFFPGTGDVFENEAPVWWEASLGLVLSF
jgi:hypothetical protein